jgi:hypothetical protein
VVEQDIKFGATILRPVKRSAATIHYLRQVMDGCGEESLIRRLMPDEPVPVPEKTISFHVIAIDHSDLFPEQCAVFARPSKIGTKKEQPFCSFLGLGSVRLGDCVLFANKPPWLYLRSRFP